MYHNPYKNIYKIKKSTDFVEVVDENNIQLCIMRKQKAMEQNLFLRSSAIIAQDNKNRYYFFKTPQGINSFNIQILNIGQSYEEAAEDILKLYSAFNLNILSKITQLKITSPVLNTFVNIYKCRIKPSFALQELPEEKQGFFIDKDELAGIKTDFPDLLNPFIHHLIQHNILI